MIDDLSGEGEGDSLADMGEHQHSPHPGNSCGKIEPDDDPGDPYNPEDRA
jgi:hypothetical protein